MPYNILRDFMSLMKSREELPLDISPSLLHLETDYVERNKEKDMNNNDFWNLGNTYSSFKEVKLENEDGIGPLQPVPWILLR